MFSSQELKEQLLAAHKHLMDYKPVLSAQLNPTTSIFKPAVSTLVEKESQEDNSIQEEEKMEGEDGKFCMGSQILGSTDSIDLKGKSDDEESLGSLKDFIVEDKHGSKLATKRKTPKRLKRSIMKKLRSKK